MRLTARGRFVVAYVVFVLAALAVAAWLESRAQTRWLRARDGAELVRTARAVALAVERVPPTDWRRAAASLDTLLGLRVTFVARDGRVVADSRQDARVMENHLERPEVRGALRGGVGDAVRRSQSTGTEYHYAAAAFRSDSASLVRLAEPLADARGLGAALLRLSLAAALGALFAGFVVIWRFTSEQTARIRALEQVAVLAGRGESAPPVHGDGADALGRLGLALEDVTAQLRARFEALRRERDDRESILAHLSDGVALVDEAGRLSQMNHAFASMLDAPRPAEPGTPFSAVVRSPELDDLLGQSRAESRTIERELRLWTPRAPHVRAVATPLGGPGRGAVLLVLHDLTEAERLQRMRQDFVANVSHELRTPLTSLRGYAETLLEGGLDDAEYRESFVRVMRDQAMRLQQLVEDLLALAELERPEATLRLERFDLRSLAERQVFAFRPAAHAAGLVLELAPGAAVPVSADRVRLEQAIANLLDNAVKYTERGRVDVVVGADEAGAWCEVRDTGPGIPAGDAARIFERFYRVDKARSREKGGTGLGLSIVKHVAGMHGGEVTVRSVVGEGSTFRIAIPREAGTRVGRA